MIDNTGEINFKIEKFSLDSSVVIAFFKSNLGFILREVFKNKVYFSSKIFKEIRRYDLSSFNYHILSTKTMEESEYFYELSNKHISFSVADAQLITICKFNNIICVSFEKKMRKVCKEENIRSIGLLHILKEAVGLKLINKIEVKNIVFRLRNEGLYLTEESYNKILEEIEY